MSYILVYLLYCDSGVRGGEPSSSGGVTGTIFIVSGVRGGAPGGARGPGGSADIGVLSRGSRTTAIFAVEVVRRVFLRRKTKKNIGKKEYFETLWGGSHREKTNKSGKKNFGRTKKKSKNQSKKKHKSWGLGRVSQESQN